MSVPNYVNVCTANTAVLLAISVAILTNGGRQWRRIWPWSAGAKDSQEDADYTYLLQGQEVSVLRGREDEPARPDASRAMTVLASGSVLQDVVGEPRPAAGAARGGAMAVETIQDHQGANATVEVSKSQAAAEVGEVEKMDVEALLKPSHPKAGIASLAQKAVRVAVASGRTAEDIHSAFRGKVVHFLRTTRFDFWFVMPVVLILSAISLFIMYCIAMHDTTGAPIVRDAQASFYKKDLHVKQTPQALSKSPLPKIESQNGPKRSRGDEAMESSPDTPLQSPQVPPE